MSQKKLRDLCTPVLYTQKKKKKKKINTKRTPLFRYSVFRVLLTPVFHVMEREVSAIFRPHNHHHTVIITVFQASNFNMYSMRLSLYEITLYNILILLIGLKLGP